MMGHTGAYQILRFQQLYGIEPLFIDVTFVLATIGVLKEIIRNDLSLI